jgi:hypothetical protein
MNELEALKARVTELENQMVRLIEAGHLMADVSTDHRRKIWLEAVKEATK